MIRGREARHRVREDLAARSPHAVHRARDHEQRVRGVEPAAHADDRLGAADRLHALHESRHLDVERLVAVLREARGVVGHEGEAVERAAQADVTGGRVELEVHGAEHRVGVLGAAVVVERALAQAILAQAVEIDVGDRVTRPFGKALGLGEQHAAFVDEGLSVPREVVRRLALARCRVGVGREAAQRLRLAQDLAVFGARDRDRAARQVEQHRGSGEGRRRRRRNRNPHVFADFGVHDESGHVERLEQQVGSERSLEVADPDVLTDLVVAGCVPPALVELAVGGQVRLGHDAEQLAAMDHDRAVVEAVAVAQRRTHHEHREELFGCRHQRRDGRLDRVEHGILHHEIVDRVPGEAQLGEHGHGDGVGVALARGGEHRFGVALRGRRSRRGSCTPRCARSRGGTRSRTGDSWHQSVRAPCVAPWFCQGTRRGRRGERRGRPVRTGVGRRTG